MREIFEHHSEYKDFILTITQIKVVWNDKGTVPLLEGIDASVTCYGREVTVTKG